MLSSGLRGNHHWGGLLSNFFFTLIGCCDHHGDGFYDTRLKSALEGWESNHYLSSKGGGESEDFCGNHMAFRANEVRISPRWQGMKDGAVENWLPMEGILRVLQSLSGGRWRYYILCPPWPVSKRNLPTFIVWGIRSDPNRKWLHDGPS